jgi:hypothetical protein
MRERMIARGFIGGKASVLFGHAVFCRNNVTLAMRLQNSPGDMAFGARQRTSHEIRVWLDGTKKRRRKPVRGVCAMYRRAMKCSQ